MLYEVGTGIGNNLTQQTSVTVVLPSNIKAGQLIYLYFEAAGSQVPITPTGFGGVPFTLISGGNQVNGPESLYHYTKVAVAGDAGFSVVCSVSSSAFLEAQARVFASTDGTTPQIGATNFSNQTGGSSFTFPSTNAPTKSGSFIVLTGRQNAAQNGSGFSTGLIDINYRSPYGSFSAYFGLSGTASWTSVAPSVANNVTGNWMGASIEIQTSNGSSAGAVPIGTGGVSQHNSGTGSVVPGRSGLEAVGDVMIADICQWSAIVVLPPPDITQRTGSATQNLSTNSLAFTIPNTIQVGDLMVLQVAHGASTTITSLPMSNSNSFTFQGRSGGGDSIDIYTKTAVSGDVTGSVTVTANISGTTYLRMGLSSWYALSGASVLPDQFAFSGNSGNNNDPTTAVTTTANHEIIIFGINQATTSGTPGLPINGLTYAFNLQTFAAAWISQPALGLSVNPTWGYGSNAGNESVTLSLKTSAPVPAWTLIQEHTDPTNTIKKSQWWRKVISSEPTSYQFWYSTANAASDDALITSFGNLNSTTPVETALCDGALYAGFYTVSDPNKGLTMPRVFPTPNDECLYFSGGANIGGYSMSLTGASILTNSPAGNAATCYGYGPIDLCDAGYRGDQLLGYVLAANIASPTKPGVTQVVVLKAASTPARPTANVRVSQLSGVIMSSGILGPPPVNLTPVYSTIIT